jgi:thiosulfate/3-mercaptopyruvate sulfurtransferase
MNMHALARPALGRTAGLIAALVFTALPTAAQTAAPLIVDVEWLGHHLNDGDLVLLHVGSQADYDAGHLQGARRISEEDVSRPHDMTKMATGDLMLELPPIDELRGKIAAYGISDSSRIVVYSGKTAALQSATRIVFTLDYLGLGDRTSLLNGGIAAWTRSGQAAVTPVPAVSRGTLAVRPAKNVVVDADYVKSLARHPNHRLVDARAAVFYRGIEASMNAKGHIPGAISIPFSEISDTNQLIDRDRVAALFQTAGVKAGETLVVYCHVGQQATAVIFAARLLGHPALLYDGSFQDWAYNVHGPVEQ